MWQFWEIKIYIALFICVFVSGGLAGSGGKGFLKTERQSKLGRLKPVPGLLMPSDKHPWQELILIEHLRSVSGSWMGFLQAQFNFTWIHVLCSDGLLCITLHPFAIFLQAMLWAPCSLHGSLLEHRTMKAFCILAGAEKKMFATLPVTNGYREANTPSSLPCESSYLLLVSPGGFVWFSTLNDPFPFLVSLPSFLIQFLSGICPVLMTCLPESSP